VNEDPKLEPHLTQAAAKAKAAREARQAEALRANLRRRKAQARGRDDQPEASDDHPHSLYPDISNER
jgi:septal ring factor EnvC (AmiA/AmiB activator)